MMYWKSKWEHCIAEITNSWGTRNSWLFTKEITNKEEKAQEVKTKHPGHKGKETVEIRENTFDLKLKNNLQI